MADIPEAVRSRLTGRNYWHLATQNEDGTLTTTPVWADVDGGYVLVNTAIGRRKERNVRQNPTVAMSMTDRDNANSWVEIRGRVVEFIEGATADDSIDALAKKYLGVDGYPFRAPGERRVLLRIEPTQVILPSYEVAGPPPS